MFDGAVNVLDYVMEDYMVLANYVQGFEDGIIEATNSPLNTKYSGLNINYAKVTGDGRFAILEDSEEDSTEETTTEVTTEATTETTTLPNDETTQTPTDDKISGGNTNTGDEGIQLYLIASVVALLAIGAVVVVKKQNMT